MRALNSLSAFELGRIDVFQLVRLLRWPGLRGRRAEVRFAASLDAGFPGREVNELAIDRGSGKPSLRTSNFCLAGTLGPLPEPFTEWLREQARRGDTAAAGFLAIFDQRLHVLRHDLKARQVLELNSSTPPDSPFGHYLAALAGLGSASLSRQVDLPPRAWLALAGILGNPRRGAHTIGKVLALLLRAHVNVEQCVGAWCPIEPPDRCLLGRANHRLGRNIALGRRLWDQHARVRVTIAGLSYQRARALLPPEPARKASPEHRHLCALLRLLLDRQYDCEVLLGIDRAQVPPALLEARPDRERYAGLRLGQTAWARRAPPAPFAPFLVPAYEREVAA
jgi:type VI secretion system protein ImpH